MRPFLKAVLDCPSYADHMTQTLTPAAPSRTARPSTVRRGPRWQGSAVALVWATNLAVVAFWVIGGGVQALARIDAGSIASAGRLAGLVSANLMLLQVLLMARIPIFEQGFGRVGITRAHRLMGMWSFALLIAHIVLIEVAYSIQDGKNLVAETWNTIWTYPGMSLAALAVIILVAVMATSSRPVRRRMRYEAWHLLHIYGYLGVGLAVPHMLWTGTDFLTNPLATAYWWTLWAVTAACVVLYRLVLPILRSRHHDLRVAKVNTDGSRGVTVHVTGKNLGALGAQPGQYMVWRFLDSPGWTRGHPFSLSGAPTARSLQISARIVGDGTQRLTTLTPGTRVLVEGPFGTMTGAKRTGRGLLMLAAGAGVAPLLALLESEPFGRGEAVLVTRDHAPEERMRTGAIQHLIAKRGLAHYALDGPRSPGSVGWLPAAYSGWGGPEILRQFVPESPRVSMAECDVYLCGPGPWAAAVHRDLLLAGFTAERIHSEPFDYIPERKALR